MRKVTQIILFSLLALGFMSSAHGESIIKRDGLKQLPYKLGSIQGTKILNENSNSEIPNPNTLITLNKAFYIDHLIGPQIIVHIVFLACPFTSLISSTFKAKAKKIGNVHLISLETNTSYLARAHSNGRSIFSCDDSKKILYTKRIHINPHHILGDDFKSRFIDGTDLIYFTNPIKPNNLILKSDLLN